MTCICLLVLDFELARTSLTYVNLVGAKMTKHNNAVKHSTISTRVIVEKERNRNPTKKNGQQGIEF